MAQRVLMSADTFERGELRFRKGQHYPLCPDSLAQVLAHGIGGIIEAELDQKQHRAEELAAHARWNADNRRSIETDPALRTAANPAAIVVAQRLAELRQRGALVEVSA